MSEPFKPVLTPEERDELIADLCDENNKLRAERDAMADNAAKMNDVASRYLRRAEQAEKERDATQKASAAWRKNYNIALSVTGKAVRERDALRDALNKGGGDE